MGEMKEPFRWCACTFLMASIFVLSVRLFNFKWVFINKK